MAPSIPRATYRLQLSADFGFDQAAHIVPYLSDLGISHLYASPFLKARPGSTHGYDITDHEVLNPEFGGEEAFARLSEALASRDMGLILDFVPNHMGVAHSDNKWWLDVLEWGRKSPYAASFDIDWDTLPYRKQGGVLLPLLGKPYGEVLEGGEITLRFDLDEGSFAFWYYEHRLPVRPDRYSEILRTIVETTPERPHAEKDALLAIVDRYRKPGEPSRSQAPGLKTALKEMSAAHELIELGIAAYAASPVLLHRLLERQHYRLAHWRVAISEINYRRFFEVNDLAGIRVEDSNTFNRAHRKVEKLIEAGQLHGLRLDHIDGLYDPAQYCSRLKRLVEKKSPDKGAPFYIVVEKILGPDEPMPALDGIAGTTGYDILNQISRVLVKDSGLPVLESAWQTSAAPGRNFAQIVDDSKNRIVETGLASEFTVLVRLLSRIAAGHWSSRDFTEDRLREALKLFVRHFPVYRTYICGEVVSDRDRDLIASTIAAAREDWVGPDSAVFEFLQDVLTLDLLKPEGRGYSKTRVQRFVGKLQQFTGPVAAKAIEDTSFYRYHRLLALNEVGNDPTSPALSLDQFHTIMKARADLFPAAMTATATHDTKRGEDARMRILALSELADEWSEAVRGWREMNEPLCSGGKQRAPSRAHEYMLYQALIGAWPERDDPDFPDRMKAFALKAAREGKQETSWTNPNDVYEAGLTSFVEKLLDPTCSSAFLDSFAAFSARTARLGACNSFTQLVLKCMLPGVPDFYQGCEFLDLSMVDPDNRRAVDFDSRKRLLGEDRAPFSWNYDKLDACKLALTKQLLDIRASDPDLFAKGSYERIEVKGADSDNVIGFARHLDSRAVVILIVRHFAAITDAGRIWPTFEKFDTQFIAGRFKPVRDLLTGRRQEAGYVVVDRPALVLECA